MVALQEDPSFPLSWQDHNIWQLWQLSSHSNIAKDKEIWLGEVPYAFLLWWLPNCKYIRAASLMHLRLPWAMAHTKRRCNLTVPIDWWGLYFKKLFSLSITLPSDLLPFHPKILHVYHLEFFEEPFKITNMASNPSVYIVSAVRTPVGSFLGWGASTFCRFDKH